MKSVLLYILLIIFTDDINEIAAVNRIKNDAEKAYNEGNYQKAIQNYSYLYDALRQENDRILLNLSNAYFNAKDTSNALFHYNKLTDTRDPDIKSIAYQQLGIIANNMGKYDVALEQFKNSLRANPENNDSRYNYELLKRLMQENQQQQNQNQDQQNKDQQNQDQQDQNKEQQDQQNQEDQKQDDQENKQDQQQQNQDQQEQQEQQEQEQQQQESSEEEHEEKQVQPQPQDTEEMEISEEMAKMILEAMRNNEVQYIQQQQKKATKPKDNSKPDW
jgi:tetratricopeptide (TPR) repeat protein